MADVIFTLIVIAFFGLMVLLVRFCDRIIGPDDDLSTVPAEAGEAERAEAEVGS